MYDDTSQQIYYSLCNSNNTPIFPADSTATFELDFPPMKGTQIAGTGYQLNGVNQVSLNSIFGIPYSANEVTKTE
jgi:hypothetical protein